MAKPSENGVLTTERRAVYALNQQPFYGTISLSARIHGGPKKREIEVGAGPLTTTPNNLCTTFLCVAP